MVASLNLESVVLTIMKLKIQIDENTINEVSEYFKDSIDFSYLRNNGKLLFWLHSSVTNYYLLHKVNPIDEFIACTPFIFIHRSPDNLFYTEEDYYDVENIIKYPYIIETKGCDDGHKVWRFSTISECNEFLSEFMEAVNQNLFEDTDDFYDVWEYFDKGLCWIN